MAIKLILNFRSRSRLRPGPGPGPGSFDWSRPGPGPGENLGPGRTIEVSRKWFQDTLFLATSSRGTLSLFYHIVPIYSCHIVPI